MIVLNLVLVVFFFGLTVFVHELGHYLVARWLGLQVDVFSIGFGPAIWKRTIKGVVYKVGCLPLGGYVSLPQLDPGGGKTEDGESRNLPRVAAWKKALVAVAGASCNILFAILLAYIVYWGGKSMVYQERDCVVGYVATNSLAYASGLTPGDTIEAVNGRPVTRWDQFILESALTDEVELLVTKRDGTENTLILPTEKLDMGGRLVEGVLKQTPCLIIGIIPESSAEEAGLKPGDIIREFAEQPIYSINQLTELVNENQDKPSPALINRSGKMMNFTVTPRYNEMAQRALIGIEHNPFDIYKSPKDQIISWASPVFRLLKALVTPREARMAAAAVGGPLAIFDMIWKAVQTSLLLALWLTGLVNVNLAILNLLPIPILDGGHIVFALWEMITRRPVHEKVVAVLANIFGTILIVLFIVLTFNDIRRLILPRFTRGDTEEAVATPDPEAAPITNEPAEASGSLTP